MIRIIADSTCDLSKELQERYNIAIIPLHIVLDDKEYRDLQEITPEDIFAWSEEHKATPKTSAMSFEDAQSVMRPILDAGDEIIAFCISEQMSTTANVLRMAAQDLEAEDRVSVIDSKNLSTGIGLQVIEAAQMAAEGMARGEIVDAILKIREKVRASFVVDTLTYLHRGGRCSAVAALAGGMLKLHPRIEVENGKMDAGKKYRGKMNSVIMSYTEDMKDALLKAKKERVFITHSGCDRAIVEQVREYLKALGHFDEILETRAGGVISSHCGPGTLGVLFISEE